MSSPADLERLATQEWLELQSLADRLEETWLHDGAADLNQFLPPAGDSRRVPFLVELVKTDLEIRWRHRRGVPLEWYLESFEELAAVPESLPDLLYEEYRARCKCGDMPGLADYQGRFPQAFPELMRLVRELPVQTPASGIRGSAELPSPTPIRALSVDAMDKDGVIEVPAGYRLHKKIGSGAFGEVWRAEAPGGIPVAVKILYRPVDTDKHELSALHRIKKLRNLFLLNVHSYWVSRDGRLRVIMDLADGTLGDRLAECQRQGLRGIPPQELLLHFKDAAEALDYVHSRGMLHRDIKPANILLLEGRVKIGDFSLLRNEATLAGESASAGTPGYMPPEGFRGEPCKQSDQYSLAVTYVELRLGRRPFKGSSYATAMFEALEGKPDLGSLDAAEQQVLQKALDKVPEKRFDSCGDFVKALQAAVQGSQQKRSLGGADSDQAGPTIGPNQAAWGAPEAVPADEANTVEPNKQTQSQTPPPQPMHGRSSNVASRTLKPEPLHGSSLPGNRAQHGERSPHKTPWNGPALAGPKISKLRTLNLVAVLVLLAASVWLAWQWLNRPQDGPPPTPFAIAAAQVSLKAGETSTVAIRVQRGGVQGPIDVTFENVPENVRIRSTTIPDGRDEVNVEVQASPDAACVTSEITIHATAPQKEGHSILALNVTTASEAPPPALRLRPIAAVALEAGQRRTVEVRVVREHCEGPIELRLEGLPAGVTARPGVILPDADVGQVELTSKPDACLDDCKVRLLAEAAQARTSGEFQLSVKPAPPPPPPPTKPALLLRPIAAVTLIAGQRRAVEVRVVREHCEGPIELRLEGLPAGVTARPGVVLAGANAGQVDLTSKHDARLGDCKVRLMAEAAQARTSGEFQLSVEPLPPALRLRPIAAVDLIAGQHRAVEVRVEREHCDGRIALRLEGLPTGVTARPGVVVAGATVGQVELDSKHDAGLGVCKVRLIAEANQARTFGEFQLSVKPALISPKQARAYIALGQWHNASADYAQLLKLNPDDMGLWCEYASTLLLSGDKDGYYRVCKDVLQRFAATQKPVELYMVGRILALAPNDVVDAGRPVQMLEKAVAAEPNAAWYRHTLAVANYRAGRFDQAVQQCRESEKVGAGWSGNVVNWLLLAMAHQRLGNAKQAQRGLQRAVDWIEQESKGKAKEARIELPVPSWADRLEVQLLLREAEALRATEPLIARPIRNCGTHAGPVTCVAYSPDGKRVVSGGFDKTVRLWDIEKGEEVRHFKCHTDVVWTVAFSSDGHRVLSGGSDGTVRLLDFDNSKELLRLQGHQPTISSVVFHPDGKHALSASWDRTVRLWSLETGKEIYSLKPGAPILSLALTKDGRHALFGSNDGQLRSWDLDTKQQVRTFTGPKGMVEAVALTANGRQAIVAGSDALVHIYDVETGRELKRLKGHGAKVDCVVLSPDGSRLLSSGEDKTLRLWDLASGRELFRGQCAQKVRWVAFSPDGRRAVSACYDGSVALWEVPR